MADTRTLQNMLDRIADEIKTDDLTNTNPGSANFTNAVLDAIIHYQRLNLFAMDRFDRSIVTVLGEDTYDVPDDLITLTQLNIIRDGQRYPVDDEKVQEILYWKTNYSNPEKSLIYKYAFYNTNEGNGQILTWPAADRDGDIFEFVFQGRIPFPATPTTSNFWTTVGEQMIRHRAKYLIYRGVLRDMEGAQEELGLADEAYENLSIESAQKQSTNTLRATRF